MINPNRTLNTIHHFDNQYFNADGSEYRNANPNNYLVVPYNYTFGHAIQFANDVNNASSYGVSPNTMMVAAFVGPGSQNLQQTYQKRDGTMTYAGDSVPMFQDATSFHLGFVSDRTGYGPLAAQGAGSAYDLLAQGRNWALGNIGARQAWDNNARNMHSIAAGATYSRGYLPGPNPFNPGGQLSTAPDISSEQPGYGAGDGSIQLHNPSGVPQSLDPSLFNSGNERNQESPYRTGLPSGAVSTTQQEAGDAAPPIPYALLGSAIANALIAYGLGPVSMPLSNAGR